jgi:branched-chain amino acid transport system ATP-binding protein
MLEIKNLTVNYGAISALRGISLEVKQGDIVTLIGANGAGKTTTLRAISGLLKSQGGEVLYEGRNIANLPPHQIVKLGLSHVPEGRMVFANLTVMENLMMGAYLQKDHKAIQKELDYIFGVFPRLKERQKQVAGTLSGGEQQMLAIARCLMGAPDLVMFDEPSLGLAPTIVHEVLKTIRELNHEGLTCLLVEQNVAVSLKIATHAYVLENGRTTLSGAGTALLADDRVRKAYLGL